MGCEPPIRAVKSPWPLCGRNHAANNRLIGGPTGAENRWFPPHRQNLSSNWANPQNAVAVMRLFRHPAQIPLPFLSLALAAFLVGCGEGQKPQTAPPSVRVTVAKPVARTIVDQDEYVGRFVAVDSVEVRARVSGYLDKVHFRDGQYVKQGDLLFTIDKRPFQNTLDQAGANLETARSNLVFAEADLARGQQLMRERTISEQVFQQRSQAFRNAQAAVAASEAMVRQAALDLEFTDLKAPVSGRIGDRRVTPGNLVTGGTGTTTMLATIVSTDPIRLEFTLDEASLLRYERLARGGQNDVTGRGGAVVRLKLIDEQEFSHHGIMEFVDNVIERATGTIRARAQFANGDGLFTLGMF